MRHTTYKHLESRLRIGAFTLGQWAQVTIAAIAAAVFGGYLSPLPAQATIFVSVLLAGFPVAISYGAMGMEFSVGAFVRAGWSFWHDPRSFLAGPGEPTLGYLLHDETSASSAGEKHEASATEGALLWDV
ncbi:hypothetical protein LRS13_06190 [Svornostia abyssi]|uniref:PrgI family protein n=1 Tax=Svornostia abyssi TaxID=2898438 RepID=A0ABY5PKM0_9ACTN|nr:hypothetical protein LRS13_06190 [Parviterribacteraceae bacterium J379]